MNLYFKEVSPTIFSGDNGELTRWNTEHSLSVQNFEKKLNVKIIE